ncbi:MAG: (Fe-S)-binding protein [Desulfuromonadaceae bacterium]
MSTTPTTFTVNDLPGLDCGVCGYRRCADFAVRLATNPEQIQRCIHLSDNSVSSLGCAVSKEPAVADACGSCGASGAVSTCSAPATVTSDGLWKDSLDREFDFYLEHFPEDPGPREIIIPHNPILTREMEIQRGDILIGRPLGMSCGCPITHCGVVMEADHKTGVIVWCVTGPLTPREKGFKDIGYYIAEGYEGLIAKTKVELKIGMRYYFQPSMCMLQWRHSGLVNYINRTPKGTQVRLEGLWIG